MSLRDNECPICGLDVRECSHREESHAASRTNPQERESVDGIKDSERHCMWCGASVWTGKHGLGNCATLSAPSREVVVRYAGIMPTPEQVKLDTERLAAIGFTLALRLDTSRDTAQGELTRERLIHLNQLAAEEHQGHQPTMRVNTLELLYTTSMALRSIQHRKEVK